MVLLKLVGVVVCMTVIHNVDAQNVCVSDRSCNGHGKCPPMTGKTCSAGCKCTGNYTGTFCTKPPDCTPGGGQCGLNGNCNRTTLKCTCKNKYKGSFCQIAPFCTELGNECGDFGECNTCSEPDYNFCQCYSGYIGDKCTEAPSCTEGGNECPGGEECNFGTIPYKCRCPLKDRDIQNGYTCAPACTDGGNECNNGGTCNFEKTPFVCDCPCGFTKLGPTCGGQHVTCFLWLLLLSLLGSSMISRR